MWHIYLLQPHESLSLPGWTKFSVINMLSSDVVLLTGKRKLKEGGLVGAGEVR